MKDRGRFQRLLAALGSFALAAVPLVSLASSEAGGHADPSETYWIMGIKILDFVVVAYLLYRFLSKPLVNYLRERAESWRMKVSDLEQRRRSEEEALREYRTRLEAIDREVETLRQEARQEMAAERERVLAEAHLAAQELLRHTQDTIKREFAKAKADLQQEAVTLAVSLATEMLTKDITAKDQRRFADDYISRIGA
jgi:F-type H+-transporting ATPase subunit b